MKTERGLGINLVGLIGGLVLIASALFLPWIHIPYASYLIGDLKIYDVPRLISELSALLSPLGQRVPSEVQFLATLCWLVFFMVLAGGILAIFKPKLGGSIGIGGVILFTIPIIFSKDGLAYISSGYYVAWIGAIVSLLSGKIYKKVRT